MFNDGLDSIRVVENEAIEAISEMLTSHEPHMSTCIHAPSKIAHVVDTMTKSYTSSH